MGRTARAAQHFVWDLAHRLAGLQRAPHPPAALVQRLFSLVTPKQANMSGAQYLAGQGIEATDQAGGMRIPLKPATHST